MFQLAPHPILEKIETVCAQHSIGLTQFGLLAVRDGSLVQNLRDGRDPRRATVAKIEEALRKIEAGEIQPKTAGVR